MLIDANREAAVVLAAERMGDGAPSGPLPKANELEAMATAQFARRASFLREDGQAPTLLEQEALLGDNDLLEISFIDRVQLASHSVCRFTVSTAKGTEFATGFLVGQGLVMTNHHVLQDASDAERATIEFDYRRNVAGSLEPSKRFKLAPGKLFVADKTLDFALCAVQETSIDGAHSVTAFQHLRLIPRSGKVQERTDFVTIIQHPDGEPMQIALRENQVTRAKSDEQFIWYRADTAHGSSGAPVMNDTLQVAALHSSGRIKRDANGNYVLRRGGVTNSTAGLKESDVEWEANVGTRISVICTFLDEWKKTASRAEKSLIDGLFDLDDVMATAVANAAASDEQRDSEEELSTMGQRFDSAAANARPQTAESGVQKDVTDAGRDQATSAQGTSLVVPLQLNITLGLGAQAAVQQVARRLRAVPAGDFEVEKMKLQIPVIYDGLDEREGFDSNFLELDNGLRVEMPALTASGRSVAAPLLDGSGNVLRYHKFSVIVHKKRRLPLITASNVDWRPARRARDESGKAFTREALTGISGFVGEQWVLDERIDATHQLPDTFYTNDQNAFDKGHIVRRDDVCWGDSFEDMQMANGDTYHVTNCTPQIEGFNRGTSGEENWGDFESEIQKITKKQQVIIFAGPILAANDRWFKGKDDSGPVRIQVPASFWKVVVAKGDDGRPEVYGFLLEQDVTDITKEKLKFSETWEPAKRSIANIEKMLRGWVDLAGLEQYDMHKDV